MVQESDQDASGTPAVRGVPGMCNLAMALGLGSGLTGEITFPSCPESALGSPRRNWKVLLMRGGLNRPTNSAASATPPQIKGRGWMDNLQLSCTYSLHCRSQMTKQNASNTCCIQDTERGTVFQVAEGIFRVSQV